MYVIIIDVIIMLLGAGFFIDGLNKGSFIESIYGALLVIMTLAILAAGRLQGGAK